MTSHTVQVLTAIAIFIFIFITGSQAADRKNVLFLVVDDLRPQLGAYEGDAFPSPVHPKMYTPNFDKLASKSLLLKYGYAQQAVCNPSRASVLTGRRPDTTHVTDMETYWRIVGGNYTTIPQYFKQNGYVTAGMGKIFHPGKKASGGDDPISWTEPYFRPHRYPVYRYNTTWQSVDKSLWSKYPLEDMQTTQHAKETLQKLAANATTGQKNFFVGVGWHRPHLPFWAPDVFFEHYPPSSVKLPPNPYAPVNMNTLAWTNYDELRAYANIGTKYGLGQINITLPDQLVMDMRRAYYASVSYIDDQIGQLLDELDKLGLAESTVVSLWGDHGWHLGEHAMWCKHTNFEIATHVPFMIHIPGLTDGGVSTDRLTELVDLFPTVSEAAGLPAVPLCPEGKKATQVDLCTEGISLLPLVEDPKREWKAAAFSQFPRMGMSANVFMGYTMRTDKYRYTEWPNFHYAPDYQPDWNFIYYGNAVELYDHTIDPEENFNRAFEHEYKEIRKQLREQLRAGWRKALPPSHPNLEML